SSCSRRATPTSPDSRTRSRAYSRNKARTVACACSPTSSRNSGRGRLALFSCPMLAIYAGPGCVPASAVAHTWWSAAGGEADVEAAEVGLQAGVLDGDEVGGGAGVVVVGVPHAGRGDERTARFPVHPGGVAKLTIRKAQAMIALQEPPAPPRRQRPGSSRHLAHQPGFRDRGPAHGSRRPQH